MCPTQWRRDGSLFGMNSDVCPWRNDSSELIHSRGISHRAFPKSSSTNGSNCTANQGTGSCAKWPHKSPCYGSKCRSSSKTSQYRESLRIEGTKSCRQSENSHSQCCDQSSRPNHSNQRSGDGNSSQRQQSNRQSSQNPKYSPSQRWICPKPLRNTLDCSCDVVYD